MRMKLGREDSIFLFNSYSEEAHQMVTTVSAHGTWTSENRDSDRQQIEEDCLMFTIGC